MTEPKTRADTPHNEQDPAICPPGRLPGVFLSTAERIQRTFLSDLSAVLEAALETAAVTAFVSAEQRSFGAFLEEHKAAGCVITLDLPPLNGCALLSFSRPFVFRVLDIFMATPASAVSAERQTLTAIELHVLQELFDLFARCLRGTWQSVYPIAFDVTAVGLESSAESASAQAAQTAVVLKSQVQIGGEVMEFDLALPGFLFRMAETGLQKASGADDTPGDVEENLLNALGFVQLELESVLHSSRVSMSELLQIEPGQILSLETPADSLFECLVNGKPRFKGEMLSNGGRAAFRIVSPSAASA